jgi:arylamine N-acetyltransferase
MVTMTHTRTERALDIATYLDRIGYHGGTKPTLEHLRAMHRAHFLNVPFENLDIARGVEIHVDEAVNHEKLVKRRRGGFCLEVTGMFARILRALGYRVDVLGAQVEIANTPMFGSDREVNVADVQYLPIESLDAARGHMVAIVHLDEPWLVDVGFGGRIVEPLRLNEPEAQRFGIRTYSIASDGDRYRVACDEPGTPPGSYQFLWRRRRFDDFLAADAGRPPHARRRAVDCQRARGADRNADHVARTKDGNPATTLRHHRLASRTPHSDCLQPTCDRVHCELRAV